MSYSLESNKNSTDNLILFSNKLLFILILFELILLSFILIEQFILPIIVLLFLLIPIIFLLFIEKPHYLLFIFILSILAGTIVKANIGGKVPPLLWVDILFPVIVIVLIIITFHNKKIILWNNVILLYLLFTIWSSLSFIIAIDKLRALLIWKSYFGGLIVFLFALISINDYKKIGSYLNILILWGIILSIMEIYITYTMGNIKLGLVGLFFNKNLLATSWGKSNYLATFHVLIIPITLGLFFVTKSLSRKIIIIMSIIIMFTGIILTLSRGGLLSLTLSLLILFSGILKPRTFIPLLFVILLIALILILNPLTMVLFERLSKAEQSLSYFTRLNFYKDVWQIFLDNPITGVGLGNLGYHSKFIISVHASAHNIILGLLGETGVVGAILFLSLLFYFFIFNIRSYLREKNETIKLLLWAFISSFFGVIIHSMIEPNFEGFQFSIMFWATLAVFTRMTNMQEEEKNTFSILLRG